MKLFINVVILLITLMIFSGCATKKVTDIAEDGKTLFYIDQVSNAYFNPSTDEILIDTNIRYSKRANQERSCFNFIVDTQWRHQKVLLTEDTQIECPDSEGLINYEYVPILRDKSDKKFSPMWIVEPNSSVIYIDYYGDAKVMLKRKMTVYPAIHQGAYLFYSVSIPFDIITFPIQLIVFIANVADGVGGFPLWLGYEDKERW